MLGHEKLGAHFHLSPGRGQRSAGCAAWDGGGGVGQGSRHCPLPAPSHVWAPRALYLSLDPQLLQRLCHLWLVIQADVTWRESAREPLFFHLADILKEVSY